MQRKKEYVELMDTTLRDGEQTPGISFVPGEKLQIANLLLGKLRVDRIEIASARVSEGERDSAKKILDWAEKKGKKDKVEILGFIDRGKSVDWIRNVGGLTINLLAKGSEAHCIGQLGKKPEQHFSEVSKEIENAVKKGLNANLYLEDWSSGMKNSFGYVFDFMRVLLECPVKRIMLPDTLGLLQPRDVKRYLDWMLHAFPDVKYDFHGHNDYGMGTANCLEALMCGVSGVHVTVNGLGERAGNPSLCEVVAGIHDMTGKATKVREEELADAANIVETMSGKRLASNAPIVGSDVFTQTCGVHADGDKKGNLYANPLTPERFRRKRRYALGKLSGKASIDKNLENLGLELSTDVRDKVLREVIRLGDRKKKVTPEDLPFIIADVMKSKKEKKVIFTEYKIVTDKNKTPSAYVQVKLNGETSEAESDGDGGYDAFMRALKKALKGKGVTIPKLLDYEVRIPPGGKTDALVETTIRWDMSPEPPLLTFGIDSDQMEAAIEATERMLNAVVPA